MATERQYDEIIAPMLKAVADRCTELGMTMVARVEWARDEAGITQVVPDYASVAQKLTQLAAHSHGNFDGLCIAAIKHIGPGNSICLNQFKPGN